MRFVLAIAVLMLASLTLVVGQCSKFQGKRLEDLPSDQKVKQMEHKIIF